MCRYICVNISIFWYIHIYVFMRYYTCCFIPENQGAHFWAHSGEWNTFPYVKMQKNCTKNTSSESFAANDSKKVWNLKLPRVLRTPTKITSPRQPLTVRTRIKRNHPSRNTPTNQIEEQKTSSLLTLRNVWSYWIAWMPVVAFRVVHCQLPWRWDKARSKWGIGRARRFCWFADGMGDRNPKMRIFPL